MVQIGEQHVAELQDSFVPRPTDAFVTTSPKCGTTWTQQICVLLKEGEVENDVAFDPAEKVAIDEKAPWLDLLYGVGSKTLDDFEGMSNPRIFKTHAPFELMPTQRVESGRMLLRCLP